MLPARIDALESEERHLSAEVSGPDFYKLSADDIRSVLARLEALQQELHGAYARWDELDNLK